MTEENRLESMAFLLFEFEREIRQFQYRLRPERVNKLTELRKRYNDGDRSEELSKLIFEFPRV